MTNAELRALYETAEKEPWNGDIVAIIVAMHQELPRLLDDSDRLAKLREYVAHHDQCRWFYSGYCTCGLRELLAEGEHD